MLNEEYSSDSDDEDFIPEGIVESEDDDDENDASESESEDNEEVSSTGKRKKQNKSVKRKRRKKKNTKNIFAAPLEEIVPDKAKEEQDEAKSESKAKDLWDDFLADVEKPAEKPKPKSKNSWAALLDPKKKAIPSSSDSTQSKGDTPQPTAAATTKLKSSEPSTVKVTQIFEFAGEEVRVEKEVAADSEEAKAASLLNENGENLTSKNASGEKKPPRGGGLSGILNLLDSKKQKLSTLQKTKLDWNNFKSDEGIEEELNTHLKSKAGYLEKKAFLERTDLRQFEIERNMRQSKR